MAKDAAVLLSSLTNYLPQLTSPPFPPSTVSWLSEQCNWIKQHGRQLEETNQNQLDKVQADFARLCQDSSLDLELRLQLLEVIELRSLGWNTNEDMETFYRDKLLEVEERREALQKLENVGPGGEDFVALDDTNLEAAQEMIQVGSVSLFISSIDKNITMAARKQLEEFFSLSSNSGDSQLISEQESSSPRTATTLYDKTTSFTAPLNERTTHQYTREKLLTLATSKESLKAPVNWANRIQTLPNVIVKQM